MKRTILAPPSRIAASGSEGAAAHTHTTTTAHTAAHAATPAPARSPTPMELLQQQIASTAQTLYKANRARTKDDATIRALRDSLRDACVTLILEEPVGACSQTVTLTSSSGSKVVTIVDAMWTMTMYEDIQPHRQALTQAMAAPMITPAETEAYVALAAKLAAVVESHVSTLTRILSVLLPRVHAHGHVRPVVPSEEARGMLSGADAAKVALMCSTLFNYMGDLCRYTTQYAAREPSRGGSGYTRAWEDAVHAYMQAVLIAPMSGLPHHKLSLVANAAGSSFLRMYRLMRALSATGLRPSSTFAEEMRRELDSLFARNLDVFTGMALHPFVARAESARHAQLLDDYVIQWCPADGSLPKNLTGLSHWRRGGDRGKALAQPSNPLPGPLVLAADGVTLLGAVLRPRVDAQAIALAFRLSQDDAPSTVPLQLEAGTPCTVLHAGVALDGCTPAMPVLYRCTPVRSILTAWTLCRIVRVLGSIWTYTDMDKAATMVNIVSKDVRKLLRAARQHAVRPTRVLPTAAELAGAGPPADADDDATALPTLPEGACLSAGQCTRALCSFAYAVHDARSPVPPGAPPDSLKRKRIQESFALGAMLSFATAVVGDCKDCLREISAIHGVRHRSKRAPVSDSASSSGDDERRDHALDGSETGAPTASSLPGGFREPPTSQALQYLSGMLAALGIFVDWAASNHNALLSTSGTSGTASGAPKHDAGVTGGAKLRQGPRSKRVPVTASAVQAAEAGDLDSMHAVLRRKIRETLASVTNRLETCLLPYLRFALAATGKDTDLATIAADEAQLFAGRMKQVVLGGGTSGDTTARYQRSRLIEEEDVAANSAIATAGLHADADGPTTPVVADTASDTRSSLLTYLLRSEAEAIRGGQEAFAMASDSQESFVAVLYTRACKVVGFIRALSEVPGSGLRKDETDDGRWTTRSPADITAAAEPAKETVTAQAKPPDAARATPRKREEGNKPAQASVTLASPSSKKPRGAAANASKGSVRIQARPPPSAGGPVTSTEVTVSGAMGSTTTAPLPAISQPAPFGGGLLPMDLSSTVGFPTPIAGAPPPAMFNMHSMLLRPDLFMPGSFALGPFGFSSGPFMPPLGFPTFHAPPPAFMHPASLHAASDAPATCDSRADAVAGDDIVPPQQPFPAPPGIHVDPSFAMGSSLALDAGPMAPMLMGLNGPFGHGPAMADAASASSRLDKWVPQASATRTGVHTAPGDPATAGAPTSPANPGTR